MERLSFENNGHRIEVKDIGITVIKGSTVRWQTWKNIIEEPKQREQKEERIKELELENKKLKCAQNCAGCNIDDEITKLEFELTVKNNELSAVLAKNMAFEEQIESMKCCGNCKHLANDHEFDCTSNICECLPAHEGGYKLWELDK